LVAEHLRLLADISPLFAEHGVGAGVSHSGLLGVSPARGDMRAFSEDGTTPFGTLHEPESPLATEAACDAVAIDLVSPPAAMGGAARAPAGKVQDLARPPGGEANDPGAVRTPRGMANDPGSAVSDLPTPEGGETAGAGPELTGAPLGGAAIEPASTLGTCGEEAVASLRAAVTGWQLGDTGAQGLGETAREGSGGVLALWRELGPTWLKEGTPAVEIASSLRLDCIRRRRGPSADVDLFNCLRQTLPPGVGLVVADVVGAAITACKEVCTGTPDNALPCTGPGAGVADAGGIKAEPGMTVKDPCCSRAAAGGRLGQLMVLLSARGLPAVTTGVGAATALSRRSRVAVGPRGLGPAPRRGDVRGAGTAECCGVEAVRGAPTAEGWEAAAEGTGAAGP